MLSWVLQMLPAEDAMTEAKDRGLWNTISNGKGEG